MLDKALRRSVAIHASGQESAHPVALPLPLLRPILTSLWTQKLRNNARNVISTTRSRQAEAANFSCSRRSIRFLNKNGGRSERQFVKTLALKALWMKQRSS